MWRRPLVHATGVAENVQLVIKTDVKGGMPPGGKECDTAVDTEMLVVRGGRSNGQRGVGAGLRPGRRRGTGRVPACLPAACPPFSPPCGPLLQVPMSNVYTMYACKNKGWPACRAVTCLALP